MKVIVVGTPQEIASLASKLQGMQPDKFITSELKGMKPDKFIPSDSSSECPEPNQKCSC